MLPKITVTEYALFVMMVRSRNERLYHAGPKTTNFYKCSSRHRRLNRLPTRGNPGVEGVGTPRRIKNKTCQRADELPQEPTAICSQSRHQCTDLVFPWSMSALAKSASCRLGNARVLLCPGLVQRRGGHSKNAVEDSYEL